MALNSFMGASARIAKMTTVTHGLAPVSVHRVPSHSTGWQALAWAWVY